MPSMKVCFFLQRSFARIGDAIAANLKEEYGIEEFCSYVSPRSSLNYLRDHGQVEYTSMILDEEIHARYTKEELDMAYLQALEKKIGLPDLWPYFIADRVLMQSQLIREYPYNKPIASHEDLLRMVQVTAKALEEFLDRERPDAVVFAIVGSLGPMLLYHLARARGIPTAVIFPNLLTNGWTVSLSHFSHMSLKRELENGYDTPPSREAKEEAERILASFREKPRSYVAGDTLFAPDTQALDRTRQLRFLLPNRLVRSLRGIWREWLRYRVAPHDYTTTKPWYFVLDRAKRKLRNARGVSDLYEPVDTNEPFAFYALHYEPEFSLLVQAPFFKDQTYIIEQIARSLPVGWKLYVKEHPQMAEYRPRSFYTRLKRMPNVKLIHPSVRGTDLLQHSKLVCSITGTIAFEACLLKRPVIMFGNHFINDLSFVRHVERIADLPYFVQEQTERFAYSEDELVHHLAKLLEVSATTNLLELWYQEQTPDAMKNGSAPLADLIAKRLGLQRT